MVVPIHISRADVWAGPGVSLEVQTLSYEDNSLCQEVSGSLLSSPLVTITPGYFVLRLELLPETGHLIIHGIPYHFPELVAFVGVDFSVSTDHMNAELASVLP